MNAKEIFLQALEKQSAEFAKSDVESTDPLAAMPKMKVDFNALRQLPLEWPEAGEDSMRKPAPASGGRRTK